MNGLASWFSFVPLPLFDLPLKSAMCRCKYVCMCGERERDRAAGKAHLRGILQSTNPFVHVGVFSAGEETVGDFF
jgi:hypothetical protein